MFKHLRKQLVITYTIITWCIITILIAGALSINEKQLAQRSVDTLQNFANQIIYSLQIDNSVNGIWLAQLEASNKLLIHIEDNGKPFLFRGSWQPPTDRQQLLEKAKLHALSKGIDITKKPLSASQTNHTVFTILGEQNEEYLCSVTILPSGRYWNSVILLRYFPQEKQQITNQRFLFFTIDLLGLLLLFIVNWFFVGKFIMPIEINRKNQIEFVAAASHELRSPLAVIQASISVLPIESEQSKKFIKGIKYECKRMGRLIDDMLILANADAKNWPMVMENIEIDTLLIETYELFLPLCQKKEINLSISLPQKENLILKGDSQRIRQVLTILLDNAVSYTPYQGAVKINAFVNARQKLQIELQDNGPGISEEQKKLIFERFYRGDKSRNDKKHFGLGLSIAKELIHLHEGELYCKDTPGGGCTFVVLLRVQK